jgi:glycosyltransferase involved in cell wall biosynthesis
MFPLASRLLSIFRWTKPQSSGESKPTSDLTDEKSEFELSVVIPCLNEAETIGICAEKAVRALRDNNIAGEVIVADNGSTDGSQQIAIERGARVVPVSAKGYGNALMGGIAAAKGRYVLMGDADDSYDFLEIPRFLSKLREGHDLVQGCRLPSGGGTVAPGAMPFSHRWIGNPMFTRLARMMFGSPFHDVYCGMRGFRRSWYNTLNMRCTGMEFATEMIIKASLNRSNSSEVPITLHPDGRITRKPHLRTYRDGWRTLRFFLMSSPTWLFSYPGLFLVLLGLLGYSLAMPAVTVFGAALGAHTLLVSSLAIIVGYQAVMFGVTSRTYAAAEGLLPSAKIPDKPRVFTLERGLLVGVAGIILGLGMLGLAVLDWWRVDFGNLDYAHTMRKVIPGVTLVAVGFQTLLGMFFIEILRVKRK